jgi:hypothetical protein
VRDAAAPVHREAGGLVERDDGLVLVDHGHAEVRRRDRFVALGDAQRRDADALAGGDAVGALDTPAVHPDFAASQDPVDAALRHAPQARHEKWSRRWPDSSSPTSIQVTAGAEGLSLPWVGMPVILYLVDF